MTADFNALDWFLIVAVGLSTLFGFRAGLIRVVIGFGACLVGIFLGMWFYETPAAWFARFVQSAAAANALGFLVVFLGVILAGGLLARGIASIFRFAGLTWLDRLLGGAAGFVRGMLVVVGIVMPLMAFASNPMPDFLKQSKLLPYTVAFGRATVTGAPARVREQFEQKAEELKALWKGMPESQPEQQAQAPSAKPLPPAVKAGPFKKEIY